MVKSAKPSKVVAAAGRPRLQPRPKFVGLLAHAGSRPPVPIGPLRRKALELTGGAADADALVRATLARSQLNPRLRRNAGHGDLLALMTRIFEAAPVARMPGASQRARHDSVRSGLPSAEQIRNNVAYSTAALERLADKISRPGIRLASTTDVPLYFVEQDNPKIFVRVLNGRRERGVFADGTFRSTD